MKRLNIVLIFLSVGIIAAKCQQNPKHDYLKPYNSIFLEKYTLEKKDNISPSQYKQNPYVGHFKSNSLKNVSLLQFTSKNEIKKNTKLRFKILAYQYDSNNAASEAVKKIESVKTTQDESVFDKDWDYVVLKDNTIIRLDAGCLYSDAEWNKLKDQFLKAGMIDKQLSKIECRCGGSCK